MTAFFDMGRARWPFLARSTADYLGHSSAVLGCDMVFSLYLPPQAEERAVPVLCWLQAPTLARQPWWPSVL